jgi:hypothetical protein
MATVTGSSSTSGKVGGVAQPASQTAAKNAASHVRGLIRPPQL